MALWPNVNRLMSPKMCLWFSVFLLFQFQEILCASRRVNPGSQIDIKPGNIYQVDSAQERHQILTTFCWSGEGKTLLGLWKTATVQLTITDEDFLIYKGDNISHVAHLHEIQQQSWFSFLPWKEKSVYVSPFNLSCMGVFSKAQYSLRLDVRQINFNRFLMFSAGILLFLVSPSLCEKVVFHYTTGTLIGVLGSVLIVVYLTSRLVPKKSGAYAVLIGGSSVVFYLLRSLWDNLFSVLREYQYYVIGYLIISSVISFGVCYRFGPVTNPRTIHLLQWALQVCGLFLVFESSEHHEAAMGIILVTLAAHNIPKSWGSHARTLWFHRFPPKVRLLSEDEYFEQSRLETRKALDDLRQFSRSPDCNAWKTMSRLKDPLRLSRSVDSRVRNKPSPRCVEFSNTRNSERSRRRQSSRFAEFVEGKSHLSDREVLDYETSTLVPSDNMTDDESDEDY